MVRLEYIKIFHGFLIKANFNSSIISYDEGETWDMQNEITLAEAYNGDLGYPATVQLNDGTLLTVFYQQDVRNESTSIFTTHWKLK